MSSTAVENEISSVVSAAVASEALRGLRATPKTLSPWLFYDAAGSTLFEAITRLPEYYLTRTERAILATHAREMLAEAAGGRELTLVELGAGTAAKTGLLLAAAVAQQGRVVYQPVDVSETALDEARRTIEAALPRVTVLPQVADYTSEPLRLRRPPHALALALYIGSSVGNFAPAQARDLLVQLRSQLQPGDGLLLGTDLVKDQARLLAAYDDAAGVTAAFNRNILTRLNREMGADFAIDCFAHRAIWNAVESRIEMHLVSTICQRVRLGPRGPVITFAQGESIHTENSYKFTGATVGTMLQAAGFAVERTWRDTDGLFAVTLARVG